MSIQVPAEPAAPPSLLRRLLVNLFAASGIVALLSPPLGILQTLRVSSINMVPTLAPDDHVLVRSYGSEPMHGDVVVYRSPFGEGLLVGRLVALAGQQVELNERGLHLDGTPATAATRDCLPKSGTGTDFVPKSVPVPDFPDFECPIAAETLGGHRYFTRNAAGLSSLLFPARLVPHDHVFVLNDNRIDERDSRIYGPIPLAAVVGVASFVYYAFDETGIRWDRMTRRVS